MLSKSNISVYIITSQFNHRSKSLQDLSANFSKITFITFESKKQFDNQITINPYPNPTGILRVLGFTKLKHTIDKYAFFPSTIKRYLPSAQKILSQHIENDFKNGKKVCIITCAPPHAVTLLGLSLQKRYPQLAWIIDWQDLWSYDEVYFHRVPRLYKSKLLNIEQDLLKSCNLNVTTNHRASEVLMQKYGVPSEKVCAINHPYDPEEENYILKNTPKISAHNTSDEISLGFLGTLSKPPKVPGERILAAVDKAMNHGIKVNLQIFGDPTDLTKTSVEKMQNKCVTIHDRLPHAKSLLEIAKCDFLIITLADLPNCKAIMHAKLPHYLMLKKPILAFVPADSYVADVINRTGSGIVIPTDKDWGDELVSILNLHTQNKLNISRKEEIIQEYSWKNISEKWIYAINHASGIKT